MMKSPMKSNAMETETIANYREVRNDWKLPHSNQRAESERIENYPEVRNDCKLQRKTPKATKVVPRQPMPPRNVPNPKRKFMSPKNITQICTFNVSSNLSNERQILLATAVPQKDISTIALAETNKICKGDSLELPRLSIAPKIRGVFAPP